MNKIRQNEEKKVTSVSALPDFSQIYSFLQYFGRFLQLPPVTLNELERFFENEFISVESPVVFTHWRLLSNVCKRESRERWQHMAVKFARRSGVLREAVRYSELSVEQRMKVFRLVCEEQFDSNAGFKADLKKQLLPSAMQWEPLGTDREGQRHWMLRDSSFEIRLYGERNYDEVPPKSAVWEQLARSLDELAVYIGVLESRWSTEPRCVGGGELTKEEAPQDRPYWDNGEEECSQSEENCDSSHVASGEGDNCVVPQREFKVARRLLPKKAKGGSLKKASRKEKEPVGTEGVVGCLKCHRDTNYKQMLLCDECDKECHMYCQYPVLWSVPDGKWICPLCREKHLFTKLKRLYSELSEARAHFERTAERKQRSVARLQKSGLLLQNIIMDEGDSAQRRSRRARKDVNYAELNDFYLPPLGQNDLVGNQNDCAAIGIDGSATVPASRNDYDVPGTRFSRRIRCIPGEEDTVQGSATKEVVPCNLLVSSSSEEPKSELNDFHLTPLGQNDFVNDSAAIGIGRAGSAVLTTENDHDVTGTRFSHQIQCISEEENRVEGSALKEVDLLDSSSSEGCRSDLNPESDCERREIGGIGRGTIDGNDAMADSSSTSTEMDDYSPNSYDASRGSGDLADELPGVDTQTGSQQGLMVQPRTLPVSDSLDLGRVSSNTIAMFSCTESSRHSGVYNPYQ